MAYVFNIFTGTLDITGSGGVTTLDGLSGDVVFNAGAGIVISTTAPHTINISSPGSGVTFPLIAPESGPTNPSFAFSEASFDTGMYSSADGNISFSNNGVLSVTIDPPGDMVVTGNITAANFPLTGTANTFAGYNNVGSLDPITGWAWDNTSGGARVTTPYDPVISGSGAVEDFSVQLLPTADSSVNVLPYSFNSKYDPTNTNFNYAGNYENITAGQQNFGTGTVSFMRSVLIDQNIGDGTNASIVSQASGLELLQGIQTNATATNIRGLFIQLNQDGILTNDYNALDINVNTGPIGHNFSGVNVFNQSDITVDGNFFNADNEGAVGGNLNLLNINNNGAIAGYYNGAILNNNNTIGLNYAGLNINNSGAITGYYNGLSAANSAHVLQSYQGLSLGNNTGGDITFSYTGINAYNSAPIGQDYNGFQFSNNSPIGRNYNNSISNSGSIAGDATLLNMTSNATHSGTLNGININLQGTANGNPTGITVNTNSLVSSNQVSGLVLNGGAFQGNSQFDTAAYTPSFEFQLNGMGGSFQVSAGHPTTGQFGFGNNLGTQLVIQDNFVADSFVGFLGFSLNGFVNQVAVSAGKTMDTLNYMLAGGSVPDVGQGVGNITNLNMFAALGLLPAGGNVNVTNLVGFHVQPTFTSLNPTNAWGVRIDDPNADNWFAKNVVIGGTSMHPTGAFALDVTGDTTISGALTVGTGASGTFTTADLKTVTVVSGIITSIV